VLTGLILCGQCGRRLEAHWVHRRAGYRCRHGRTTASGPQPDRPPNLYWREDALIRQISLRTPELFGRRPTEIAAYLRQHDLTITAWPDGIAADRPAFTTPEKRQNPRPTHPEE
jgi:site-specific DNA recombinase